MNRSLNACSSIALCILAACQAPRAAADSTPAASAQTELDVAQQRRALDFMLGQWMVRTGDGVSVGASRFDAAPGGCAILEQYTQGESYAGAGLHRFDPCAGRWRQTWTDNAGNEAELYGDAFDGGMHYEGRARRATGAERRVRGSFVATADGVVQVGETTVDGSTWTTEFELHYERLPEPGSTRDSSAEIQRVLDIDSALSGQRDRSCETIPLADSVRIYVLGLDAIDFEGTPTGFQDAFRAHRDAWSEAIPFLAEHADLRGEMHALFDQLRERGPELDEHVGAIMRTWKAVAEWTAGKTAN